MEKYVKNIIDQFASAYGINYAKAVSFEYRDLLKDYLRKQQQLIQQYKEFLKLHNIDFDRNNCVEIGKSGLDSVAKNTDAKILSPYTSSFKDISSIRLIEGSFDTYYGKPTIIRTYDDDYKCERAEDLGIDTFMTQNPYKMQNPYSKSILSDLQNVRDNVIVGMFGSIYDADCDEKIDRINSFRQRLCVPANIEYDTKDNNYYCVVTNSYTRKK